MKNLLAALVSILLIFSVGFLVFAETTAVGDASGDASGDPIPKVIASGDASGNPIPKVIASGDASGDALFYVIISSSVSDQEKQLILSSDALPPDMNVIQWYDVILSNGKTEIDPIEITLPIESSLPPVSEGQHRVYLILRSHNGTVDVITSPEVTEDGATFMTGLFSTYALAYGDFEMVPTGINYDPDISPAPSVPVTSTDDIPYVIVNTGVKG